MTKEEYVEKIIYLNSQICQKPDDYTKEKVRKNNKAARKLTIIENALQNDIEIAMEVYKELLDNEDKFIKSNAAALCLQLKIHVDKSIEIFEYLEKYGESWEKIGAERQLKIWRGEIEPDDPG